MCQHVRDRCPIGAKEGKAEERCRLENEVPPSTANLYKSIPPTLVIPFASSQDLDGAFLVFVRQGRSAEKEYVEKGVVVEDVDKCTRCPFAMFFSVADKIWRAGAYLESQLSLPWMNPLMDERMMVVVE
jgi:hypothetical protein